MCDSHVQAAPDITGPVVKATFSSGVDVVGGIALNRAECCVHAHAVLATLACGGRMIGFPPTDSPPWEVARRDQRNRAAMSDSVFVRLCPRCAVLSPGTRLALLRGRAISAEAQPQPATE